jgi:hypothetical protein
MNRAQHPSNNAVLGAPRQWDQDELPCDAMPITRTEVNDRPAIISFWRPTAAELAQLNAGALVAVWMIGHTMPPTSIGVEP